MRSKNGAWAAFDRDNTREMLYRMPFSDFGAMIDPPTEDVTAHVLEMLAALDYDASGYEIINLGNNRTVSLLELVNVLEDVTGIKARIDWQPLQPGDVPQTFADIGKAQRVLGYAPKTSIDSGLAKFWLWLHECQAGASSD